MEVEEENYSEKSETSSRISNNTLTVRHVNQMHFEYDITTINNVNAERDENIYTYNFDLEQKESEQDSLLAFCPAEVCERNYFRNLQQQQQKQQDETCSSATLKVKSGACTMVSNSLQIPILSLPTLEKPPKDNVYMSENITIIDVDHLVNASMNIYNS